MIYALNRQLAANAIRSHLLENSGSIGSWIQIPSPSIAEIMGSCGYDWVAIDMEHGSISVQELPNLCRALELGGTLPLVRVAQGYPKDCKQALDAGAGGIIVPMIESANQLREIQNFCCWPPSGTRGVGFSRANLFGQTFNQYILEAQSPLLVAMIETYNALDNLEEILDVDGLDAIMVGPYDLSASLGLTGDFTHPKFLSVMNDILEICKNKSIPIGIHVVIPSIQELQQRISEGYRFIAYSIDSVFLREVAVSPLSNLRK